MTADFDPRASRCSRFLTFPNVLTTGHQAFFTADALTGIAETTLANLTALRPRRAPRQRGFRREARLTPSEACTHVAKQEIELIRERIRRVQEQLR